MTSDTGEEDAKTTEPLSEEANIEKAIRFWKHPSLLDVPTAQKREYLHERGVSDAQIHKAWDRIAEEPATTPDNDNNNQNKNNSVPNTAPASQPNPLGGAPAAQPSYPNPNQTQSPPPFNRNPYNQSYDYQYGQQQQPQSATPYAGGMYQPHPEEDEGPINLAQGATLVTLGGMLGLTAAAALRWLNGGDFNLLPPPAYPDGTRRLHLVDSSQEEHDKETVDDDDDDDEDHADPHILEDDLMQDEEDESSEMMPTTQEKLLEIVQGLSDTMQSHVSMQEKLLQKITTKSSITDHSMDLLRSSSKVSSSEQQTGIDKLAVWAKLVEIKAELSSLQSNKTDTATVTNGEKSQWEQKLTNTLENLDESLSNIRDSIGIEKISKSPPSQETPAVPVPENTPLSTSTTPAAQKSTPSPPPSVTKPDSSSEEPPPLSLHESIRTLVNENEATALRMGAQLLYLYIVNLSGRPDNSRYRKIYTCNENFKKVENLTGGKDFLYSLGFEERDTFLEWLPDADQDLEDVTLEKLKEAAAALSILKSSKPSDELLESVLATLSPEPLSDPPPPPCEEPQTPIGSGLVSPPMPRKHPYVPPSDRLERIASGKDENNEQLETAGSKTSDIKDGASNDASPQKSNDDAMKIEDGST